MAEGQTNESEVGLPVGTKIGKYEVADRLGVGGQAIVYKCYDEMLDRYVAIKQISPHLAENQEFLSHFRAEAKILAKLGAEIITIHELIEDPRGLFIVMEFVEGHSLETILRDTNGPLETKAALQLLWRLAATLHQVHQAGIIHRDLKPSNIIVAEGLHPKITDFGVAASGSGQASMKLGTTKYMAPELFEGGPVDGRADEYSLGFIAYEMLLGRPKFNEIFADLMRDPRSEPLRWMKWHGNDSVSAPALHEVNPQIPQPLSDIVARMMAKKVEDRFASMEDLGRAIKTSFSPRRRAAQPAEAGAHARSGAASEAALAEVAEMGAGDEADHLEVGPEGPTTRPLPKRRLSLRARLILLGVIVASCVAIGVILGLQGRWAKQRLEERAQRAYDEALAEYDKPDYPKAIEAFDRVVSKYKGTTHAAKAAVLGYMARARQAVLEENWEAATAAHNQARTLFRELKKNEALTQWTRNPVRVKEIEDFEAYMTDARAFSERMAAVRQSFQEGDFDKARRVLVDDVRLYVGEFPQREKAYFDMLAKINETQFRTQYDRLIAQATQRQAAGDYAAAEEAYTKAQDLIRELMNSTETERSRGALTKDRGQKLLDMLDAQLTAMKTQKRYDEAMTIAAGAATVEEKIQAYLQAKAIRPDKAAELDAKIQSLKAAAALDRARQAKQMGELSKALAAVKESLEIQETPEAKALLEDLTQAGQRTQLIAAARRKLKNGQYAEALAMFEAARKIKTTVPLRNEIDEDVVECRYQIQLAEAEQLRAAKKYAEAAAAYRKAMDIKPAAQADITARLTAMARRQTYESLIEQGRKAFQQERWSEALAKYREAKATLDTREVDQLIDLTRYSENVARGRSAMEQEAYESALGYFRLAQRFLDTEEVQKLIAEAQKKQQEAGTE